MLCHCKMTCIVSLQKDMFCVMAKGLMLCHGKMTCVVSW